MNKISPERQALKDHAITLRKQGWTERAIADEVGVPRTTIERWLIEVFDHNSTMGNTVKSWSVDHEPRTVKTVKNPQVKTFLGPLEDFETDIRFPLIVADPPWNISVANSMHFTFTDKKGIAHTPMKRDFGAWDFQGDQQEYLASIQKWLAKLYDLAADDSWCWFWCSYRYLSHINNIAQTVGWQDKGWFVWAKTNVPPLTASINGTLLPSLEPCLILRKGKGQLRTNKVGWPNYRALPIVAGDERLRGSDNVAAKPASLLFDIIEWCTSSGDWVLDAFAGTGSTTRASIGKGRNSFAVEMDKRQMTLLELECEGKYGITPIRS